MFTINADQSIHLTRGDTIVIEVSATMSENEPYIFQVGDVVRFKVFEKGKCDSVVLAKDVEVENETQTVDIRLASEETKIGELIHKPKDYWYEVELNPENAPQTIIGYDVKGPKVFRLFPEGDDKR